MVSWPRISSMVLSALLAAAWAADATAQNELPPTGMFEVVTITMPNGVETPTAAIVPPGLPQIGIAIRFTFAADTSTMTIYSLEAQDVADTPYVVTECSITVEAMFEGNRYMWAAGEALSDFRPLVRDPATGELRAMGDRHCRAAANRGQGTFEWVAGSDGTMQLVMTHEDGSVMRLVPVSAPLSALELLARFVPSP